VQKARFAKNVLARSASLFRARNSRHGHATLLDAAGAPLGTVQALLGHASPEVTRQIYLHAMPAKQRRAVEGVEKLEEVAQRPN
jgi:integrase